LAGFEVTLIGRFWGWIGRSVGVQWDELYVRILDPNNGLLLREHVRQKRGWYRIKEEDHPMRRSRNISSR
jgi:hypothetical protein